jgi:metal-responsive CopG/Arc/MetJ family transcriptional regulator
MRWYTVADSVFVHRKRLVTSLANELVEPLDALSKKTRVPKSRLIDEAVEDLLKKYEKRMAE